MSQRARNAPHRSRFAFMAWLIILGACQPDPLPVVPTPACQADTALAASPANTQAWGLADAPSGATGAPTGNASTKAPEELTFRDDILPILSSNDEPERYRCTVCHAAYAKVEGFDSETEVAEAISAMEDKSMPRAGNPVKPEYIALIKAWAKAGYAADKNDLSARKSAQASKKTRPESPPSGDATSPTRGTRASSEGSAPSCQP